MANKFTVRDADGLDVHLSQRVWQQHILFKHRFMVDYLDAMKVTVARPTRTYANTTYTNGVSYWKMGLGKGKQAKRWLTVVVNYKKSRLTRREYGEIVTAYFADDTPPRNKRIDEA